MGQRCLSMGLSEGTLAKLTHACLSVRLCAGASDSRNEPALNLEFDRRTDAGL